MQNLAYPGLIGKKEETYMDQGGYGHTRIVGVYSKGLSKREHYAALAMQGLIASDPNDKMTAERMANLAVELADELIKRLAES